MEKYKRKSVFAELKDYDHMAKEHDYIEITGWHNGEGFDVDISGSESSQQFGLTYGQFKAIKKLAKQLDEWDD